MEPPPPPDELRMMYPNHISTLDKFNSLLNDIGPVTSILADLEVLQTYRKDRNSQILDPFKNVRNEGVSISNVGEYFKFFMAPFRVDLYEEDCHFVQCRKKSEDCHFLKYTLSGDNLKFECFTWNTN
jgi:hypothetical protein